MTDREAGKRGMTTFSRDAITLRFGNYLDETQLPVVPKAFGHVFANPTGGLREFYGNNRYGDCVMAGAAHEECHWANSTRRPEPPFSEQNIVAQYLNLAGGDKGLDPVATAKHRVNNGITDTRGMAHKIKGFVRIDTLKELEYGCYLFDLVGVGAFMPDSAERHYSKHEPWDDTDEDSNPQAGHYFPILGRNSEGLWIASTWGGYQGISDAWLQKYCFDAGGGALVYFSLNYLTVSGKSREGFDEAQLDADLKAIS